MMNVSRSDTTGSEDCSEGEEDEPSSSFNNQHVEDALTTFRKKWQQELQINSKKSNLHSKKTDVQIGVKYDPEEEAKVQFLKGVEMERAGKLYEAIQFYRRAVQLVPDIEFKLHQPKAKIEKSNSFDKDEDDEQTENKDNTDSSDYSDDEEIKEGELLTRIQKKISKMPTICVPKFEQKSTHISSLPTEMILYILRWVVSSDLDLRSLEIFSMVCRGFYLCARDVEIWRLACLKVWGLSCGSSPTNYPSWRQMFIERTRLLFNGCYIGKTTYIRHGENSFQDQFYRPWHLVTYYRYLRFFPEGNVLVLTSSDEPAQCVNQLKNKNAKNPILKGYYRLLDDKVILMVHRQNNTKIQAFSNKGRRRDNLQEAAEQTFHMELEIKSTSKRRHVQLVWSHYSIFTKNYKGDESTCNFDLVGNRFPPFWFSRVKSYTSESDSPL